MGPSFHCCSFLATRRPLVTPSFGGVSCSDAVKLAITVLDVTFGSVSSFSSADYCGGGKCVPAMFGVGVAPAHEEPRSGPNNSAPGSTSGRSTKYGSGHLIRVFRDIGRIFSLLFLLSHPSPVGDPLRRRVQSQSGNMVSSKAKNGFNCVSCGTYRGDEASCVSFAKTWNPAERVIGGPRESGNDGSAAEHMSAPEVPVMQSAPLFAPLHALAHTRRGFRVGNTARNNLAAVLYGWHRGARSAIVRMYLIRSDPAIEVK